MAAPSTPEKPLHQALGLTDAELEDIIAVLGREPNSLELALYGVMWSEHCSYKSSRIHLKRLPTEGPTVLVGPGENAGVVDAGDGIAVAIRIESHNHPSAIEPYQGAATGVGGILRDIFTMGARPLAVMDPLFFGEPDDARQRWLIEGVVSGISGYGNSVGVPTVGGELTFDRCYQANPLVNVLCVGALPVERLVLGIASGVGNLAVLLGSSTGRDGIGGVSVLASAGFAGEDGAASLDEAKRPSTQVGDPYEEKRLIEACLSLLDEKLVVGIQDLGGAGLACATSETAARGRVGMDVDVSAVPRREPGMEPWEVMTSESQERMLAIVTPASLPKVIELCDRWEVAATVVGRVTDPGLDADGALLRLQGPGLPISARGMALSTDSNPRWCALDPRRGTAATVAEGLANVAVTGATGVAVVNCLNFGNPEHPEVMWQLSEAIDGMGDACRVLGLPVIGGNVSLYNESGGVDIDPTPVIGTLGLLESLVDRPPSLAWAGGQQVLLVGQRAAAGERAHLLGGSRLAVEVMGRRGGELFDLDLDAVQSAAGLVSSLVASHAAGQGGSVGAVHDVGAGGLAVALAEMAIAGGVGAQITGIGSIPELFSERPGRYLLATDDAEAVLGAATAVGVEVVLIGSVGGDELVIDDLVGVSVGELTERFATALPNALDQAG